MGNPGLNPPQFDILQIERSCNGKEEKKKPWFNIRRIYSVNGNKQSVATSDVGKKKKIEEISPAQ